MLIHTPVRPRRTSTLPLTLTSARPRTLAWEVARTVVAPPSSLVTCLWEVFVWGFGVLFLLCACVSVSGVLFSVGVCVCVCDLLIFLHPRSARTMRAPCATSRKRSSRRWRAIGRAAHSPMTALARTLTQRRGGGSSRNTAR